MLELCFKGVTDVCGLQRSYPILVGWFLFSFHFLVKQNYGSISKKEKKRAIEIGAIDNSGISTRKRDSQLPI